MKKVVEIKSISDLRNYSEVLDAVSENSPVYLARNGIKEYAIVKVTDLDKLKATVRLLDKLGEGEKSAGEERWISADDMEAICWGYNFFIF